MATGTTQIETLITVTSRLIGVLDQEIEMLRAMEVGEIEALQDEKQALIVAYEECVRAVAANPAALEAMDASLRAELSELARRFDSTLAENARALHAVRESHDRLLKSIVDAVAESRTRQKGYSASGAFAAQKRGPGASALSLSLDRQL